MINKKRIFLFSILLVLSIALIIVALFVPTVSIVAKDTSEIIVYNKSVSLVQYLIDAPFYLTDAFEIYFNASGPIWMATASILFNFAVAVGGLAMFVCCLVELCTCTAKNLATKNNVLAKKVSLFVGWFTIAIAIFATTSFIVTTMMANDYARFDLSIAPFVLIGLSIVIIVLAHLTDKRAAEQNASKIKNSIGFALSGLISLLGIGLLFIPQFSIEFGLGVTSLWDVGRAATMLAGDPYIFNTMGDYPFGFATWVMFLLFFVCAFVFVYSVIGFIRALCGKSTSWLSSRVKRWSMAYLIIYCVIYLFVFCQLAVLWTSSVIIEIEPHFMLMPYAYALMLVPYLPYAFSTLISVNKKKANTMPPAITNSILPAVKPEQPVATQQTEN